jgi:hypothetical protein
VWDPPGLPASSQVLRAEEICFSILQDTLFKSNTAYHAANVNVVKKIFYYYFILSHGAVAYLLV